MNRKGMQPLKPAPLKNSFELLPGGGSEAQTLFADHATRMVHERLRVNKKKESGMLGHGEMNERSQRYVRPASRSAVPNGVFHGSPMEYTTSGIGSGGSMCGGRIYTKEGQEWLAKRLKQRAKEYEERATGNFSGGPPSKIDVSPYGDIDTLLQVAFTSLTTGSFSSGLNDTINKLLQALIQAGATISPSQLTTYAQAIGKMIVTARSYDEANLRLSGPQMGAELDTKKYFKLRTIQESLKVLDAAVREIARVINEPQSARQQVMSQLASRLLGRQIELYNPSAQDVEFRPAPMELGQRPQAAAPLFPPPEPVLIEEEAEYGAPEGEEGFMGVPYSDLARMAERAGLGRRRSKKYF
jgi:hypothetical protein